MEAALTPRHGSLRLWGDLSWGRGAWLDTAGHWGERGAGWSLPWMSPSPSGASAGSPGRAATAGGCQQNEASRDGDRRLQPRAAQLRGELRELVGPHGSASGPPRQRQAPASPVRVGS